MSVVVRKLDNMIEECESRIAEINRQLRVLQAELLGYQAAKLALTEAGLGRKKSDDDNTIRPLSESWRKILLHIRESGSAGTSIDEVDNFIQKSALGINRNTVRSQLSIYNSKGYLERVAGSKYRLTALGSQVAVLTPTNESGALDRHKIDSTTTDSIRSSHYAASTQHRVPDVISSAPIRPPPPMSPPSPPRYSPNPPTQAPRSDPWSANPSPPRPTRPTDDDEVPF